MREGGNSGVRRGSHRGSARAPVGAGTLTMKSIVLLIALGAIALPMTHAAQTKTESLVLGGGCFWCTEAAYELLPGVKSVVSGYSGGKELNPTYEQICAKVTGHAEVIKIEFDPAVVTLEKLLDFFWQVHNPTQVGGQGNDHGPQYRSIMLFADAAQTVAAEKSQAAAAKVFRDPITTEIVPLEKFWPAEEYHQDYFRRNPNAGYCSYVIAPKVKKLKQSIAEEKAGKK
jgi:peptide-methionine (S)-S-oxide reductase